MGNLQSVAEFGIHTGGRGERYLVRTSGIPSKLARMASDRVLMPREVILRGANQNQIAAIFKILEDITKE